MLLIASEHTCCADLDTCLFAVVVETRGKPTVSIWLGVGIPVEGTTVVVHRIRQRLTALVRMIEVGRLVDAVEDNATIAIGIALAVIRHQHEVEGDIGNGGACSLGLSSLRNSKSVKSRISS